MNRCQECAQKEPEQKCWECDYFVQPGPLRKVPSPPIKVFLEDEKGKKYPAKILVLNTTEFGIETEAPPAGRYIIKLQGHLWVEVAGVPLKGKNKVHIFDILRVHRKQNDSTRLNKEEFHLLTGSAGELIQEFSRYLPEHIRNPLKEKLLAEVEKSELLNALKVGRVMKYEKGRFRHLSGKNDLDMPMEEAEKLMRRALREAAYRREVIVSADGKKVFDLHGVPFDYKSGGLLAFDVTEVIEKERKMYQQELQAYRDAISAVTGERLQLLSKDMIEKVIAEGSELIRGEVWQAHDIPEARRRVREILPNLDNHKRHMIELCLSEAITNALKHAGGGYWHLRRLKEILRVIVQDNGSGIKTSELARATLMQHYSTKNSLGCGFTLMLYYADKIYLATGTSGTTLVLDFNLSSDC
ncbi:MAG TPA: ATP-binding protein [Peptococcaceae bacterium]|nr:MAG: ATP-binding region ATPase domain protein [Clostridia bacterium 41_269]HBT20008.1 ATP-binding protein [Peptococcaceae bacterium]